MKSETAKKFIEDNNDALALLGEKIKRAKMTATVANIEVVNKCEELISEWLQEIFNISTEQAVDLSDKDDDNLYLRLKSPKDRVEP